jgi:hypothetical protein
MSSASLLFFTMKIVHLGWPPAQVQDPVPPVEIWAELGQKASCATLGTLMRDTGEPPKKDAKAELFYCPNCAIEVEDPLTCGDCSALICRRCGTPLESADELGIG